MRNFLLLLLLLSSPAWAGSSTVNYNSTGSTPFAVTTDGSGNAIGRQTIWDYSAAANGAGVNSNHQLLTAPNASAAGGGSAASAIVANNTTGVNVKASAGTIYGVVASSIGTVPLYIKVYDNASAPTCGSGTPILRLMIPANASAANGAATNIPLGAFGLATSSGIGYCATTGIADNDTTAPAASSYLINILYN